MRVVEIQDDPGSGRGGAAVVPEQYVGRTAEEIAGLTVTRDPCRGLEGGAGRIRASRPGWSGAPRRVAAARAPAADLRGDRGTISSRAVTEGVRGTVDHFRRRWWLLAPHLEGTL